MAARNHQTSTDLAVRHQSAAAFFSDFACCGRRLESLHDLLEHYETQHVRVAGAAGVGSHFGNAVKSSGDVSHLGNASTATSCAPAAPLFRTERADSISSSHSGASNSSSTSELHPRPIFHFQNARTETPLTVGDYTKLSPNAAQAHATAMQAAATQAAQITQAALLAQQQHPTTTQLRGVAGATLANTTAQIGKRALQQSMRGSTNVTPNTPVDTVYVQEEHTTTMSNEPDASARSAFDTTTVLRAMARAQHDDAVAGSPAYYDPHAQERGLVDGLRYTQDGMSAAIDDAHASQTHSYPRQHMTAYFPPTPAPYTVMTVTPASLVCTDDEDRVEPGSLDAEDSYRRYLKALRKQERLSMAGPGYEDAADRRHPCMVVGCNKAYRNMNGREVR